MSDRNYLRKCPFCNCFFFSQTDLQLHVKAKHNETITDVPPYDVVKEATKRPKATLIYQYKPAGTGKCELCGRKGEVYKIGTHMDTTLTRCQHCLLDIMEKLKRVRFEEVEPTQPVRGWKLEKTSQATFRKD